MTRVRVETIRPPVISPDRQNQPRELFSGYVQQGRYMRTYDVAPDGRFVMIELDTGSLAAQATSLQFVEHWFEELTRLVPIP